MKRIVKLSFRNKDLPFFSCEFGGRGRVLDLPLIAWLTFIWVLLWSGLNWANVLIGAVVAVAVCLAFPLPRVDLGLRLHPWGILMLMRLSALRHVHLGRTGHPADLCRPPAPGRRHRRTAALPLRPDARGHRRRRVERARRIGRRGTPRHGHRLPARPRRGQTRRTRRGAALRLAYGGADRTGLRHTRRDRPRRRTAATGRARQGDSA